MFSVRDRMDSAVRCRVKTVRGRVGTVICRVMTFKAQVRTVRDWVKMAWCRIKGALQLLSNRHMQIRSAHVQERVLLLRFVDS